MHILLTRPLEDCSDLIIKFKELGHNVSHLPLIKIKKMQYEEININDFAAIIFTIGVAGIFLNRKNIIVILMSIELILLAVNINLVSFSIFLNDLNGQIFTLFILTVAAAEAAIGLAIIVVYYRNSGTIRVEEIDKLKG